MKTNVFENSIVVYHNPKNGKEMRANVLKVSSVGDLTVSFLDVDIPMMHFDSSMLERFTTADGEKLFFEINDKKIGVFDARNLNNRNYSNKNLIDWVIEVLKENNRPMTYKEIGKEVKEKGYKFPFRENENKTSIETSIHTRWFERVNMHHINDIKRISNGVLQYVG